MSTRRTSLDRPRFQFSFQWPPSIAQLQGGRRIETAPENATWTPSELAGTEVLRIKRKLKTPEGNLSAIQTRAL